LCIVEDSNADWQKEAVMMKDVYGHSFCNISAISSSYDTTRGLFNDRVLEPRLLFPFSVEMEVHTSIFGAVSGQWNLWNDSFWQDEIDEAPLASRGRVVQERFLARRVVHFAQNQIFRECLENARSETDLDGSMGMLGLEYSTGIGRAMRKYKIALRTLVENIVFLPRVEFDRSRLDLEAANIYWRSIVTTYSACNLTQESDRLIAISGIAKKFQELYGDNYLAGLWQHDLYTDLLWKSNANDGNPVKSSENFAPSWSWASISGGNVEFNVGKPTRPSEVNSLQSKFSYQVC
jgi:hypothetical protein